MTLSDNEKRDIIKYLEAGKPLPEKYRFLLFDDDREVELLWNGKNNDVTSTVLPFQVIEQIDEPRSDEKIGLQSMLFDDSGRQLTGWTNKLIWGDNKLILSSLKNGPMRNEIEAQGGLKMIYIDPPFDVGADFSMNIEVGEESFTKRPSVIEEVAYRDTWGKGADSFLAMIYERLLIMRDLLAEDGSVFVHCDWRLSGYMRVILEEVFGQNNFKNELVVHYTAVGLKAKSKKFHQNTESIFFYTKDKSKSIYNEVYEKLDTPRTASKHVFDSKTGKASRVRDENGKIAYFEVWENKVDNFIEIPALRGDEKVGYPTQKAEILLERLIKATTNEEDLIADFFCGSGTTMAVAERLNRKWIGSDLGKFGVHTSRKRMIEVQRKLKKDGTNFRAFEILNIGRYERENYLNINSDLRADEMAQQAARKEEEFITLIIKAYSAERVDSFVNMVGKKRDRLVAVGPISTPVSSQQVHDIVSECKGKGITKVDILGFDYEMGLDFHEYGSQGIDVNFRIIPREVFDKKAVERGHVKFYDVAFIDAKPIIKGVAGKKELSVELLDFSVFYNQDNSGETIEALRPGGAKVVVEDGQVVKVSKDKDTEIISREILTKKWSDWIDYWAVDFDFSSRKEMIRVPKTHGDNLFGKGEVQDLLEYEEVWTGDYIFDNEWQSFRTKKKRELDLVTIPKEVTSGRYKVAIKIVDIFGNDTTRIIEVEV
ncbi:MAG TPA: site-specific DNA-methyltransferase [Candidatus Saccharibacteria bacterium]|nr:site-specific DNA-methyltransferase [Candidatus Saccharibacteria bacterium]